MPLASTATPILTAAVVIAILIGAFKNFLPAGFPSRDATIRTAALALGIALSVADYYLHAGTRWDGVGLETAAGTGLANGAAAILTYHLADGSALTFLQGSAKTAKVKVGQILRGDDENKPQ